VTGELVIVRLVRQSNAERTVTSDGPTILDDRIALARRGGEAG